MHCSTNASLEHTTDEVQLFNYTYHTEKKTWNDARKACQNEGGELLSLDDLDEQESVVGDQYSANDWWIGLANRIGRWQWVDGSTSFWRNWMVGPPKEEECVYIGAKWGGRWKGTECSSELSFICKIPG